MLSQINQLIKALLKDIIMSIFLPRALGTELVTLLPHALIMDEKDTWRQ